MRRSMSGIYDKQQAGQYGTIRGNKKSDHKEYNFNSKLNGEPLKGFEQEWNDLTYIL